MQQVTHAAYESRRAEATRQSGKQGAIETLNAELAKTLRGGVVKAVAMPGAAGSIGDKGQKPR